jgi:tRNA(Arg) A34 adenosine deaminase TadA
MSSVIKVSVSPISQSPTCPISSDPVFGLAGCIVAVSGVVTPYVMDSWTVTAIEVPEGASLTVTLPSFRHSPTPVAPHVIPPEHLAQVPGHTLHVVCSQLTARFTHISLPFPALPSDEDLAIAAIAPSNSPGARLCMGMALFEAVCGPVLQHGGPFGAIIIDPDRPHPVLARGHNTVPSTFDPTAHAEVNVIRRAAKAVSHFHLPPSAVLFTSCCPCPLCLSAARWAGIQRIVFGARPADAAAAGYDDAALYAETARVHAAFEAAHQERAHERACAAGCACEVVNDPACHGESASAEQCATLTPELDHPGGMEPCDLEHVLDAFAPVRHILSY